MRKIVKFTLWSAYGIVSGVVVLAIVLTMRLASGPVEVSVPRSLLDRVVAEAAPGWRIESSGAELDFSSNDGLNGLKLRDVVLSDASGNKVVSAPVLGLRFALSASLNPAEALTIREVALSGASVDVIRDESGGFQLALGEMGASNGADDPLASLHELGSLTDLPQLRIEDAEVRYSDLARGTSWRTEKAQLIFSSTPTGLSGTLGVVIDGGIGGAQLDVFHTSDTGDINATLTLSDVRPSRIADLDPLFAPLARIDAPLSGTVTLAANDGGAFSNMSARLKASEGNFTVSDHPIAMRSFNTEVSCAIADRRCLIDNLSISTADFSGSATGSVTHSEQGIVSFAVTVADATARQDDTSVFVGRSKLSGSFDPLSKVVKIIDAGLSTVSATGLPNGMSASAGALSAEGTIDLTSGIVKLPTISASTIKLTDSVGHSQTMAAFQTSFMTKIGSQKFRFDRFEAFDLAVDAEGVVVDVSEVSGSTDFDLGRNRVDLEAVAASKIRIERTGAKPSLIGSVGLRGAIDLESKSLADAKFRFDDVILSHPELYTAPVRVDDAEISLAGALKVQSTEVDLIAVSASINGLAATAQGKIRLRSDGSVRGQLEASLGAISLSDLPNHWPLGIAPGGLSWVTDNVQSGTTTAMTVSAQFDESQPQNDTLDLRFGFKDALVSFAPNMPPIKDAKGSGMVTLDRFDISLSGGYVDAPMAGPLSVKGSAFAIADFSTTIPKGDVKLRASGDVQSVLRLLDSEPLGVISPTGFDISTATGQADVRVSLHLPLTDEIEINDVQFDARAKVHKYDLTEPETGLRVTGDLLRVKATPDGLALQSDARIGGMAARLGYSLGFDKPADGKPESILTLESFLSLADFARHGVELDDYVDGQAAMTARIETFEGGAARIHADADLTNLFLKADQIGWSKPAGSPATMRLSGFRNPDGAGRIEALALRGEGVSADGSIGFDHNGQVTRANFSRIILGSAVDTSFVYGRKTNGDVGILVKGARLDMRRSFAAALEGETTPRRRISKPTTADISVQVGRVFLRDDLGVFDLSGGIRLRGGELHAANISGKLNGSAATKILAERRNDGMAIRLTAPDAGAFIRATDVFVGAYDGALILNAVRHDSVSPAQISGTVLVRDMVVHDAPTLGRILSGGAIGSLMGDLANGGIRFSKIQLPFRGVGSRWTIEDGVAFGPQIGLTLDGGYDLANRRLALNGSVSPAYAINGALGNVPLLGKLLTGGEGEGVFGVTFRVDGDTDRPIVDVNPLSALAPGFLRKIMAEAGKTKSGPLLNTER